MENAGMAQDLSKKQPMNSKWGIFLLKVMILCNLFLTISHWKVVSKDRSSDDHICRKKG